jgi:hypothetical protein
MTWTFCPRIFAPAIFVVAQTVLILLRIRSILPASPLSLVATVVLATPLPKRPLLAMPQPEQLSLH